MLPLGNYLCNIAVLRRFIFQGVSIDIEPIEGLSDSVLVLHLEAMFTEIIHLVWNIHHPIFILEYIADIR